MDDRLSVSSFFERRSFFCALLAPLWIGSAANAFARQDAKPKEKDSKPAPTVYTTGGDVKPPKITHYVEPAFTDTSKDAFVDGVVKLKTTVTPEGLPIDIEIIKGLNDPENHNAIEAVKQWRFQPGTKAGVAVNVRVNVEIAFHLM